MSGFFIPFHERRFWFYQLYAMDGMELKNRKPVKGFTRITVSEVRGTEASLAKNILDTLKKAFFRFIGLGLEVG
ncbi:hypothetical protein BXY57_2156 [Thermoflavifilum aggregans]|uniref:Uncharacterized protein n=1 Tax=Thermoflavifilum aggregans TaxID=454188 RepID=A0A2M9CXC1_9BACT|nr:hypothetical protein BXY57_2156 [Thermoflavifilum aggregans]